MKRLYIRPFLVFGILYAGLCQPTLRSQSLGSPAPSEVAKRIAAKARMKPEAPDLGELKRSDEAFLREEFERQPLANRIATAFALAHIGGESALATLRKPLDETNSPPVIGRDEKPLIATLFAVGNLAQRSDAAFEYLRSKTRRDQWQHTKKWPASGPATQPDLLLCASSLRALATTGRPGVLQEIEKFSDQFSADEIRPIAGVVVDAAFYHWYGEKFGLTAVNDRVWSEATDTNGDFVLFKHTETGKQWLEWWKLKKARPQ